MAAQQDDRALGDPGTAAFRVEKYPFFLLNRLVGRYNVVIGDRLRAIGLDIPYWRVLMVLGEASPRSVREIADMAVINLSTMTRIVQRMEAAGWTSAAPSDADGRVTVVALTAAGETKLAQARATTAPVYAQVIRGLSARDFQRLIGLLDTLHANLADDDA